MVVLRKALIRFANCVFLFVCSGEQVHPASKQKAPLVFDKQGLVPGTGFEPAHGFPRCDLNTVRLPISPPGQNDCFSN